MWTWTFQVESYIKHGSITGMLNQRRDWNSCWVKITIYSEVLYGSLLHICWIKYYWVDATMLVNFISNIIKCIAFFMSTWVLPSLFETGALWFISNFLRKYVSKANHYRYEGTPTFFLFDALDRNSTAQIRRVRTGISPVWTHWM